MKMTKNIFVIGLGGVGGYFGFKIAQYSKRTKNLKTTFIARQETFEVVSKKGLTLLSPEHADPVVSPDAVVSDISEITAPDLILICVKEYDLAALCRALKEKIKRHTVILPLMNGVDIYDRIRETIDMGTIMPSCVYVASHIKEKGTIEHQGKPGKIISGSDPKGIQQYMVWAVDFLKGCGIDLTFKANALPDIWTKFYFIASFGLVSARYDQPMGAICEIPHLKTRATSIMQEIGNIASKKGVVLPENINGLTFQKAAAFPYHTPTSLQLDIQSKKPNNELELFAGAIIRYGKELGVPVPETAKIYREIRGRLQH